MNTYLSFYSRAAVVACLFSFSSAASAVVIAFDMVGSASQNLNAHTNTWAGAFSSASDGFEKYRRGVSGTIPGQLLDDTLSSSPADLLGIIDENNTDTFFGVTDTVNSNNTNPVSASWEFDITGSTNLSISIDMGAMGDFEASSDSFSWAYSIDGGPLTTLFESLVDEAISQNYALASGTMVSLNDPMTVGGVALSNQLQSFSSPLPGMGSDLTLVLTADTNGGSEAFAFQNLVIESSAPVPEPSTMALLGLGFACVRGFFVPCYLHPGSYPVLSLLS